jgi:hypothetical protein
MLHRFLIRSYSAYLIVFILWILTLAARLKFNGLVFGFDYGLYQPDGKYYTFQALRFSGESSIDAANQVVDWYRAHGLKMNVFTPEIFDPSINPILKLTKPRILYPLLSAPFVSVLGIPGMLVLPSLSLLILLVFTIKISKIFKSQIVGWLLVFAIIESSTILRWVVSNCTDSILVGLFCGYAYFAFIKVGKFPPIYVTTIFVILTSLTRFVLPIWLGIAIVLFFYRRKIEGISISLLSSIFAVYPLLLNPPGAFQPALGEVSIFSKILNTPYSFLKVTVYEFIQLFVLDKALLAALVVGIVLALIYWRNQFSILFVSVLLSTLLIGGINGTVGVNFRYQLPVLPFLVLAVLFNTQAKENQNETKESPC